MSARKFTAGLGSLDPNRQGLLSGNFTIGAAGAVSAQTGVLNSGITVTKDITSSAVGRYLLTPDNTTYKALVSKGVNMDGPAAGSAFPTTTGIDPQFRPLSAVPVGQVSVQFTRSDTKADADPASGTICYWHLIVER